MADDNVYNTLQKGQALVNQYLSLLDQRDEVNDKVEKIKGEIAQFCEANNSKKIQAGDILLKVSKKLKTVFPKKETQERKTVEEIMRNSKEWEQAIKFDVIKLGEAYDKGKLSKELMDKLATYTKKEEAIRLYVSDLSKKGR